MNKDIKERIIEHKTNTIILGDSLREVKEDSLMPLLRNLNRDGQLNRLDIK